MSWSLIREPSARVLFIAVASGILLVPVAERAWASNWQDESSVSFSVTAGHWTQPDSEESEASDVPAPQTVASSPSVMLYAGDGAKDAPSCPGGEGCDDPAEAEPESEEVEVLTRVVEEPTPAPTPTPRAPQTPRLAGGGGR